MAYHDTSSSSDISSIYMDFMAAYAYSMKTGERCNVWDPSGILDTTLKYNPQVNLLKTRPENSKVLTTEDYQNVLSKMSFNEVRRFASTVFEYDAKFNQSVITTLEKASIKSIFDVGIHLVTDASGSNLPGYVNLIRAYQTKSKKTDLTIYVMTPSYEAVKMFQALADPSWKLTSLSKNAPTDDAMAFLHMMAEVQIMTVTPALILDFNLTIDRFIYMLYRNLKTLDYFKEVNDTEWRLI